MKKVLGLKKIKSNKNGREYVIIKALDDQPVNTLTASNIFDSEVFSQVGDMSDNLFVDVEDVRNGVIKIKGDLVPGCIIDTRYDSRNGRIGLVEITVSK